MHADPAILMRRAVRLARSVTTRTSPNPPVGALVLDADGAVVGEGSHAGPGSPHAEVVALDAAGAAARGGTLIVTLAPCTRHGRTPPCLEAVLRSGVRTVHVGVRDPNPAETPSSVDLLAQAGIEVTEGAARAETTDLVAGFAMHVTAARPRITVKLALSLDGRTAAADGSSRWITGPAARRDVHRLRGQADAILVGSGTILADDPALDVRLRRYQGPQPRPVILDSTGRVSANAAVFRGISPLLLTTNACPDERKRSWEAAGAEVGVLDGEDGRVDLALASTALGERGMLDVVVESGPTLVGALVDARLVDRLLVYLAPKILGAHGAPAIAGLTIPSIADARDLRFDSVRRLGADLRLEGRFVR